MVHPAAGRRVRSPSARDGRHHRFLRPGALARLRDSKIVSRSAAAAASSSSSSPAAARLLPPSSPAPASPAPLHAEPVPRFFWGGAAGPRYPLRKRLAAARSVVHLPPPPDAALAAVPADMVASR